MDRLEDELKARLTELTEGLQEQRCLSQRVAALGDLVAEVMSATVRGDRAELDAARGQTVPEGSTTVTLRAHLTGEILARAEVTFSDRPDRVRVVDDEGHPLALNKWGHLERPFEGDSPDKELMLASAAELASLLDDDIGVPAFIA